MKKFTSRYIAILMAGFLMCSNAELLPNQISTSLTAHAYDTVNASDGLKYKVYDDYAVVTGATEEKFWVVIPDGFQKEDGTVVPVTEIASRAFEDEKTITDLTLGANVTSIGLCAFAGCTNLARTVFNEGLEEIGQEAFENCGIEELTLPATLKEVKGWGFSNNTNLRSVNFLGGNELVIGGQSFRECEALETVTMGDGVAKIDGYCFYKCSNLKTVQLSSTLKTIDDAFYYCTGLEQIKIPDSVETIGNRAFEYCTSLKEIEIGSVETIGEDAFRNCDLTTVTLHEGLKTIGAYAFAENVNLTEITIPSTVEQIGRNIYYGNTFLSTGLESITFLGMNTVLYNLNLPKTTVIRGYEGSTAQAYAEENGKPFEVISSDSEQEQPTDTSQIVWGDANGDNQTDILDIVVINKIILGQKISTEEIRKNCDTNQNNIIDTTDSLNIMKLIVNLLTQQDFPIN
ncbi:MAG: leucine-rich repeat protein [Oscillospiraceae bacterium]|nr:leucine-rich repeat protein [Oscillospiraceae bacterium]